MNIQPIKSHPHFRKKYSSVFSRFSYDERYIFQEEPVLVADGTNKKYEVLKKIIDGTEMVFKNGLLMKKGIGYDYLLDNKYIIFSEVPPSNSVIVINYKYE